MKTKSNPDYFFATINNCMITVILIALLNIAFFFTGYQTAVLFRKYEDEKFRDELYGRLVKKIAETEIAKKESP